MAEAVFSRMVEEAGLDDVIDIDSAGTGAAHVGEMAHRGTRRILQQHDIPYDGRSRQIADADVRSGDTYIVAMSQANVDAFQRRFGRDYARLYRLLEFADGSGVSDVPDPYYTGNFEYVYELIEEGCRGLLTFIREQENI